MPRTLALMPLKALQRAPRNPKLHAEDDLRASVTRFGYVEPIVLDERTERIVAGHGRLDILAGLRETGRPEDWPADAAWPPEGVEVDGGGGWLVPVLRGWASADEAEAEAYLLASNRIGEKGGWDDAMLAELLGDYATTPDWLVGTGYEVVAFPGLGSEPEPPEAFPAFDEDIETEFSCPKCGYRWSGGAHFHSGTDDADE